MEQSEICPNNIKITRPPPEMARVLERKQKDKETERERTEGSNRRERLQQETKGREGGGNRYETYRRPMDQGRREAEPRRKYRRTEYEWGSKGSEEEWEKRRDRIFRRPFRSHEKERRNRQNKRRSESRGSRNKSWQERRRTSSRKRGSRREQEQEERRDGEQQVKRSQRR